MRGSLDSVLEDVAKYLDSVLSPLLSRILVDKAVEFSSRVFLILSLSVAKITSASVTSSITFPWLKHLEQRPGTW